jgi:hypothetical protein
MTIEQIIALVDEVEQGKEGQVIGRHLHACISQAARQFWQTNADYEPTFSGFLKALRDSEPAEEPQP